MRLLQTLRAKIQLIVNASGKRSIRKDLSLKGKDRGLPKRIKSSGKRGISTVVSGPRLHPSYLDDRENSAVSATSTILILI